MLKHELKISASVRAIHLTLARLDWLEYTKMVNILPLTAENMLDHVAWAKSMLLRKDAGTVWESIIFSDEKKWNLDGPDGFQHYWSNLRLLARQNKRRQAGGVSVIGWGAFSAVVKSNLVVLVKRQNSEDYIHTVSENLLPFAHINHGTDFNNQQDNASIHVSKRSIDFFNEEHIEFLDWPSKSPDPNPIENL
uniref:Protein T04A11.11 putative n=1 Tax=Albugo laibachii Nc14 TaxID=890382 RepID=F0WDL0_9STRA|nr:protein T04A11.11 putative [Albugo laibachii Nc14]|eukprot:CCA19285.1 protein T04A11.11 putative [Albugo laibachii Nc14]